ncbi:hypothetical protein ACVWZZ_008472 [Bradyrhizobium sp. LM6.10]
MVEVAHQGRAGLAAGDVAGRTAHVDVDDVGAFGFGNPGALRHPMRLATGELDHVRTDPGGFAAQPGHPMAVGELIAGGHFGHDQTGSQLGGEPAHGRVSHPRHRCQEDRGGDFNIAYFQQLRV